MTERRRLRGKKLLVASAGLASATILAACGDDATPTDASRIDSGSTDGGGGMDASRDASTDAAESFDVGLEELPVANLLPPPDSGSK